MKLAKDVFPITNTNTIHFYLEGYVIRVSATDKGPSTADEIISSHLRLSFEDIVYYKENRAPSIAKLLNKRVLPPRDSYDLPVYTNLETAVPYLQKGGYWKP
uniref:Uncharacterized protein n=1 Tax=Glossina pallidipes TaxID=7398 RepID=A0A1A9Z803_GLOPL